MNLDSLLKKYICCPDCGGTLVLSPKSTICQSCGASKYRQGALLDLLPSKPMLLSGAFSASAKKYYQKMFSIDPGKSYSNPTAWNAENQSKPTYKAFLEHEFQLFTSYFPKGKSVAIDLSGGAGLYSRKLSSKFDLVIHCDINAEYLRFAQEKAMEAGITNCVFVRADYLRPPFQNNSIDLFICTDSLTYYGPRFDSLVILAMQKKLAQDGVALFDLHNSKWYHHDPYIFEYTRPLRQAIAKLFPNLRFIPFARVPDLLVFHPSLFPLWKFFPFLPAIRHIGILRKKL